MRAVLAVVDGKPRSHINLIFARLKFIILPIVVLSDDLGKVCSLRLREPPDTRFQTSRTRIRQGISRLAIEFANIH